MGEKGIGKREMWHSEEVKAWMHQSLACLLPCLGSPSGIVFSFPRTKCCKGQSNMFLLKDPFGAFILIQWPFSV